MAETQCHRLPGQRGRGRDTRDPRRGLPRWLRQHLFADVPPPARAPIYAADGPALGLARARALERGLPTAIYIDEMFRTGNDEDNRAAVRAVPADEMSLAGLAVCQRRTPWTRSSRACRCTHDPAPGPGGNHGRRYRRGRNRARTPRSRSPQVFRAGTGPPRHGPRRCRRADGPSGSRRTGQPALVTGWAAGPLCRWLRGCPVATQGADRPGRPWMKPPALPERPRGLIRLVAGRAVQGLGFDYADAAGGKFAQHAPQDHCGEPVAAPGRTGRHHKISAPPGDLRAATAKPGHPTRAGEHRSLHGRRYPAQPGRGHRW